MSDHGLPVVNGEVTITSNEASSLPRVLRDNTVKLIRLPVRAGRVVPKHFPVCTSRTPCSAAQRNTRSHSRACEAAAREELIQPRFWSAEAMCNSQRVKSASPSQLRRGDWVRAGLS